MITQADRGTLYDLNAVDDVAAWVTHEITTHRRKRDRNPIHRALGLLTILFALGTLMNAAGTTTHREPPRSAPQSPLSVAQPQGVPEPASATETTDDRAQDRSSRTSARKVPPPEPNKIEQVIAWALAQQGKPYRWGADGPRAFDCSGLVMQAFAQVGIKLPHYTGTMIKFGKKVSRSELQRGDILFPSSGHVVIYLGNGKQVAASSGKGKVVIQNVSSFYAARRLV